MRPSNDVAVMAVHVLDQKLGEAGVLDVAWQEGDLLVIDNWRVLHGRGADADDPERELRRVLVSIEGAA